MADEIRIPLDMPLHRAVEQLERALIVRALRLSNGNYQAAAKLLGVSRKGLYLKRKRWGLTVSDVRTEF